MDSGATRLVALAPLAPPPSWTSELWDAKFPGRQQKAVQSEQRDPRIAGGHNMLSSTCALGSTPFLDW
ncbi:hypothetical protein NDU88_006437 [Pleurodeles waltl]|uniref:Uncharacterized protein n=1 Tax=Pleurodeles waltl TaxID=8319 RepID=A0AAV7VLX4_PLEWA|nr:hypothetical protein NDU88_006437 [Pleurodeles waltl]